MKRRDALKAIGAASLLCLPACKAEPGKAWDEPLVKEDRTPVVSGTHALTRWAIDNGFHLWGEFKTIDGKPTSYFEAYRADGSTLITYNANLPLDATAGMCLEKSFELYDRFLYDTVWWFDGALKDGCNGIDVTQRGAWRHKDGNSVWFSSTIMYTGARAW